MRIGLIGLGTMGGPMGLNLLQAGHALTVHDLAPQAALPLREAGAAWADTPAAVARASDVVLTSLPGPREVEAVALGPSGLAEGFAPGSVLIDLSTNAPATVRAIAARLQEQGVDMLDAPVSGGPQGARTRNLAIMVGGDEAVFQRCRPVLEALGTQVIYTGEVGCGTICKLVHNAINVITQTGAAECFTAGVKAGVRPEALLEAVQRGNVGRAAFFHQAMPDIVLPGKFDPPAFALKLAHKDVDLAVQMGREQGVPMRLAALALQELTEAIGRGWGNRDSRAAVLLQEERAGVTLRASPRARER